MSRLTQPAYIHGIGKPSADWSQQSKRFCDKEGNPKEERKKPMFRQVLLTGFDMMEDITVKKVEPITLKDEHGTPTGQQFIGLYKGKRVQAIRRASWQAGNGKTPYIWEYAS